MSKPSPADPPAETPAKSLLSLRVIDEELLEPVGFVRMFFVRGLVGDFIVSFAFILTLGVLALRSSSPAR